LGKLRLLMQRMNEAAVWGLASAAALADSAMVLQDASATPESGPASDVPPLGPGKLLH